MRRSEIFESFVKIAEEKGLISKATPEENIADLSKTHRADSLSIDDISKLYGVKPPAPKEMQYERNIVEMAHPNPVVLNPSYDKLNSLIENINERQDILLHIVNKNNTGSIVQRKYAERELILSLVRVGNEMDNRGQDQLRALADVCLVQANPKTLQKKALIGLAMGDISALLAGFYDKLQLRFKSDGFALDYQKAIKELNDLLDSNDNWGVGYQLTPGAMRQVTDIKNKLHMLKAAYEAVSPELDVLQKPRTKEEGQQMAATPAVQKAINAIQQFNQTVIQIGPYLKTVVKQFTSTLYKQQQIAEKGIFTQMLDATEILHGGHGLIADDFDDVSHALATILVDIDDLQKGLAAAQTQGVEEASALPPGQEASSATPAVSGAPATPAAPVHDETETANMDRDIDENPDLGSLFQS